MAARLRARHASNVGKSEAEMARSGFFPCRFIGIQRRCRSRKLISRRSKHISIPRTEEEVRKVLRPASNWLASSAKFPVKHSNSCLLGWTTIKKPAVGRKLSVEKDVSECMYSIIVLYLSWTLSHCVCVFRVSFIEGSKRRRKKIRVEYVVRQNRSRGN